MWSTDPQLICKLKQAAFGKFNQYSENSISIPKIQSVIVFIHPSYGEILGKSQWYYALTNLFSAG